MSVSNGTLTIPAGGSQPAHLAATTAAKSVLVYNPTGNSTIYVGGSTVDSTTGIPVVAGQSLGIDVKDVTELYIAGTQNDVVRYMLSA